MFCLLSLTHGTSSLFKLQRSYPISLGTSAGLLSYLWDSEKGVPSRFVPGVFVTSHSALAKTKALNRTLPLCLASQTSGIIFSSQTFQLTSCSVEGVREKCFGNQTLSLIACPKLKGDRRKDALCSRKKKTQSSSCHCFSHLALLFVKRIHCSGRCCAFPLNPVWAQGASFISRLQREWAWPHPCQAPLPFSFRTPPARVSAWTPSCHPTTCWFECQSWR